MVCRGGGLTEILIFPTYFSLPPPYINNDRSLKMPKNGKIEYPIYMCKTQDPENHTLFSGTHPSRPNKGVCPLGTRSIISVSLLTIFHALLRKHQDNDNFIIKFPTLKKKKVSNAWGMPGYVKASIWLLHKQLYNIDSIDVGVEYSNLFPNSQIQVISRQRRKAYLRYCSPQILRAGRLC